MVGIFTCQLADVEAHGAVPGEAQEKFLHQLRIEGTNFLGGDFQAAAQTAPAGNIHGCLNQRFIHRQQEGTITGNTPLVSQSRLERLAQNDADVLHTVVVIHIGITDAFHCQIKLTMGSKEGQHVVQKAAAGIDGALAGTVQIQGQENIRFCSFPGNFIGSHNNTSFSV